MSFIYGADSVSRLPDCNAAAVSLPTDGPAEGIHQDDLPNLPRRRVRALSDPLRNVWGIGPRPLL